MKKIVLITGATEGIGKETAVGIARQPGFLVVLHGRNEAKTRDAVAYVKQQSGSSTIDYILADFSSLTEVRRMAIEFSARYDRLDVLINNAAVIVANRQTTADRLEMNFAVNYLATYLLTYRLLPLLVQTPGARVVNVSSSGYKQAKPDLDDLQSEYTAYDMMTVYFNAKLFCLYFTLDLAQELREKNVTVNAVHPGFVRTQLARDFEGPMKWAVAVIMPLFFANPQKGAETSVYLATAPNVASVTGTYFVDKRPEKLQPIGENRANRARLKAQTERIINALNV